jgi:hypothetical protein
MMLINKEENKDIRLKFLQIYEDFNKNIPDELIEIFKKIRKNIGHRDVSFNYLLDLNKIEFIDIILDIEVDFTEILNGKSYQDKDIVYYSNINIGDLIDEKSPIKLPIIIKDVNLNNDKLYSVISHEIRHIYDFFTINDESDFMSFVNSLNYSLLKKGELDNDYKSFLDLVYLSLEHELIARNTMIYENFINCKCSKEELFSEFEKTYMFNSLKILGNFNYQNLINIKYIDNINLFIDKFGGNRCENQEDITLFFEGWNNYFKEKSKDYLKEANNVLDKIYNVIKESNSVSKIRNVKEILLDIQNKYIKKNRINE